MRFPVLTQGIVAGLQHGQTHSFHGGHQVTLMQPNQRKK
jgi:hypothetical protein